MTNSTVWRLPEGVAANVYDQRCASRQALDRIGDKWTTLITGALSAGTLRFSELRRAVPGVSQKMLTQTLRSLERDGLVERRQHLTIPPRVEYTLTALGAGLEGLHLQIRTWAEANIEAIETARLQYAERRTPDDQALVTGRTQGRHGEAASGNR